MLEGNQPTQSVPTFFSTDLAERLHSTLCSSQWAPASGMKIRDPSLSPWKVTHREINPWNRGNQEETAPKTQRMEWWWLVWADSFRGRYAQWLSSSHLITQPWTHQAMPGNVYTQWKCEPVHLPLAFWIPSLNMPYAQSQSETLRLRKLCRSIRWRFNLFHWLIGENRAWNYIKTYER